MFLGSLCPVLLVYKSWKQDNIQPDLSEVRLVEVKKNKKKREKQQFDRSCL